MQILPLKELKDCSRISELCHKSAEPIHITKNGYADMVIMSSDVFDQFALEAQVGRTAALIQEGINAIERGEARNAFDALASVRAKYGI